MELDVEKRPKKRLLFAIPLLLLSCLFTALMGLIVKMNSSNLTAASMLFWRSVVGLILLSPWVLLGSPQAPILEKLKSNQWKTHLIRGVASFLSIYFYFFSLKFLDLTSATLLYNTIPIFVPFVSFVWKRIVIYHRLWWAIGIAFLGIIFVLQPGKGVLQLASFVALLSGVMGAVSLVAMRFGHYSDPSWRILLYVLSIQGICTGFLTLFSFHASWEGLQLKDLAPLFLVGLFGFLYQVSMTVALKFAPIRLVSPFMYAAVIFTMIFDQLIWHTSLSWIAMVGFFLIVAGAVLMVLLYPKEDLHFKPK